VLSIGFCACGNGSATKPSLHKCFSEVRKELAEYLMVKDKLEAVKNLAYEYLNNKRNNTQLIGYLKTLLLKIAILQKSK